MNKYEISQFYKPQRHILAIASGIVGSSLPNTYSNMHPVLIGMLIAGFSVKMIYGDYDEGYKWTFSDIVFWLITFLEGAIGALFFINL